MATYTSHYNLKKPATSDKIRIADFNGNAEIIDGQMYENASLGAQLKAAIGIVENTNTATHNISEGNFVIWKGVLKVASSAISTGATLSDANLSSVPNGGLNSLNDKFNDFVKIVDVSKSTGTISANSTVTITETANIPAGYKAIGAMPQYSGDDQFCWTSCTINTITNLVTMMIRNCSSANDSGTASASVVCIKN